MCTVFIDKTQTPLFAAAHSKNVRQNCARHYGPTLLALHRHRRVRRLFLLAEANLLDSYGHPTGLAKFLASLSPVTARNAILGY